VIDLSILAGLVLLVIPSAGRIGRADECLDDCSILVEREFNKLKKQG